MCVYVRVCMCQVTMCESLKSSLWACSWCVGPLFARVLRTVSLYEAEGCSWLLSWMEADMTEARLTDWQAAMLLLGILTSHTYLLST